jgi:hypothetical protein
MEMYLQKQNNLEKNLIFLSIWEATDEKSRILTLYKCNGNTKKRCFYLRGWSQKEPMYTRVTSGVWKTCRNFSKI